jgi:hypothetical protein
MKKLLLLLWPLLLLSSCTVTTHYLRTYTLKSNSGSDSLSAADSNLYVTLNLNDASPEFTIWNKRNNPITIDWQRSSLIANGRSVPYYGGRTTAQTTFSGNYHYYPYRSYHNGYYTLDSATTVQKTDIPFTYIPPGSFGVVKMNISLWNVPGIKETDKLKDTIFNAQNSAVKYQSYLTYRQGDSAGPFYHLNQYFYLSQIKTAKYIPDDGSGALEYNTTPQKNANKPSNAFTAIASEEHKGGFGYFLAFTLLIGTVVLIATHGGQ